MITVTLVGGDGSGKSTLATKLLQEFPLPMKYIYMGTNIESSNYALPWSRLAMKIKILAYKRKAQKKGITDPTYVTTHHMEHRQRESSTLRTLLRILNRLIEVTYRHLISWLLQLRGYNVIYDRHFLFDVFPSSNNGGRFNAIETINRTYYWILRHIFPVPDLIIFLFASPEVMVTRKNEATVEYLQARNEAWLRQGETFSNFVCIDANQSIQQVYEDLEQVIMRYYETKEIVSPLPLNG